jgi:hypothetical protein
MKLLSGKEWLPGKIILCQTNLLQSQVNDLEVPEYGIHFGRFIITTGILFKK